MPKRKSPLPTLPKLEYVREIKLELGGKHGYKKVKNLGSGFQGASPKSKIYTGVKKNPKQAAIALETKKFKEKHGREPKVLPDEGSPLTLPDYETGEPPPTTPSHPIPLPIYSARLAAAQQLTVIVGPAADPRDRPVESPKPLTPPGTQPDGFGRNRPLLARIWPLTPAQAAGLLDQGVQFAMARLD
jgi:hypothetical protein